MNISIEKKIFIEAVYKVARFAERKSTTLPALASILIVANDEGIKMRATNLETGIDLSVQGVCKTEGVVAIPAALLQQIASSLSGEGLITLEHTGDTVSLTSNSSKSAIKTVPYEDFPSIPLPEQAQNTFSLSGSMLRTLLTSIAACASTSTVRPELASLYMIVEGGVLTAVATDSFRLAEKKMAITQKGLQGKFLIPAKNALEIAQALPDDEIQIIFDEHQCAFVTSSGAIVSRLTNANYPDYKQIIPKESAAEAITLRKDLEQALKHTAIFSDTFQKVSVQFESKKNTLTLFAKNPDLGESLENIHAKLEGEPLTLSFNHRFLTTVFSLTNAESISLHAAGIGRPLIMKGVGDNSLLYLISPMNQ
jgi:DNA polymerase III subunit beta